MARDASHVVGVSQGVVVRETPPTQPICPVVILAHSLSQLMNTLREQMETFREFGSSYTGSVGDEITMSSHSIVVDKSHAVLSQHGGSRAVARDDVVRIESALTVPIHAEQTRWAGIW